MDRDNQQETFDFLLDVVWLAGMLNGDGCFAMNVRKKKGSKSVSVELRVILTQTDGTIIEKAKKIIEKMIPGTPRIHESAATGSGKNPVMHLTVGKMAHIKDILTGVQPFMVGNKAARARMLLEYIDHRLTKLDDHASTKNPFRDPVSLAMVKNYYKVEGRKFPPEVKRLLNDYYVKHAAMA